MSVDFTDVPQRELERIRFTVDSALLRELGERLVGKPHIALAELVKNSYDADATKVIIRFTGETIEIIDNGHGMDFSEFENFWMRIGSPHKQSQSFSREFNRPVTGSKGVGRLAVQFLASKIMMRTVSKRSVDSELEVFVNWDEAVDAGELTEAEAIYREIDRVTEFPEGKKHGTAIVLSGLNQLWTTESIIDLAKEIWPLQPPFQTSLEKISDRKKSFVVELQSWDQEAVDKFNQQMTAILDIWTARMFGKLSASDEPNSCNVQLALEFSDNTRYTQEYVIPGCNLHFVQFEIRVFTLIRRQPLGIRVGDARDYLSRFGGVHVYDSGFHLPYYGAGGAEQDWLQIEFDHAHRLHRSQLLPEELHVPRGLQFLPTNSRLFGVVHVNTSQEQRIASSHPTKRKGDHLQIQITRDRLVDNSAYRSLVKIVRWALDYYAMQEARRNLDELEAKRPIEPIREKFLRVVDVLDQYSDEIPDTIFDKLTTEITDAVEASDISTEIYSRQLSLLGPLATAGMSALAYEHESMKQHTLLIDIRDSLKKIQVDSEESQKQLNEIVMRINSLLDQSRSLRSMFTSLLEEENRKMISRFKAKKLIGDVGYQLRVVLRGIRPDISRLDESLRLPPATYAEWSAIFQNIFLNAVNAMLDSTRKRIDISSRIQGNNRLLLIQDTGVGVDLSTADELFKPFERKIVISPERRALGLGGTGLGLTIVRMIADSIGCAVAFIEPEEGYRTAFRILWREQE